MNVTDDGRTDGRTKLLVRNASRDENVFFLFCVHLLRVFELYRSSLRSVAVIVSAYSLTFVCV